MNLTSLITTTALLLSLLGCSTSTPTPSNKSDSHRYTPSSSINYNEAIRHYEREYPKTSLIHQLATNSKLKSTPHFPKRWIILEDGDLIHRYDGKSSLAFQEFRDALVEELRKTNVQLAKRNIVLRPHRCINPVASECDLSGTRYDYILLVDMKIQKDKLRISFRAEDVKKNANINNIDIAPIEIPLSNRDAVDTQFTTYQADNSYLGYAYNPFTLKHTGWISTILAKNINCIAQSQGLDIQDSRVYFDKGDIPPYSYEDDIIEDTKAKLRGSRVEFVEDVCESDLVLHFAYSNIDGQTGHLRVTSFGLYTEIYFKSKTPTYAHKSGFATCKESRLSQFDTKPIDTQTLDAFKNIHSVSIDGLSVKITQINKTLTALVNIQQKEDKDIKKIFEHIKKTLEKTYATTLQVKANTVDNGTVRVVASINPKYCGLIIDARDTKWSSGYHSFKIQGRKIDDFLKNTLESCNEKSSLKIKPKYFKNKSFIVNNTDAKLLKNIDDIKEFVVIY